MAGVVERCADLRRTVLKQAQERYQAATALARANARGEARSSLDELIRTLESCSLGCSPEPDAQCAGKQPLGTFGLLFDVTQQAGTFAPGYVRFRRDALTDLYARALVGHARALAAARRSEWRAWFRAAKPLYDPVLVGDLCLALRASPATTRRLARTLRGEARVSYARARKLCPEPERWWMRTPMTCCPLDVVMETQVDVSTSVHQ